ncbi:hypothetical protein M5K25_008673 [Dendrobium thyrsiflorum]|uniref:Uncharacterized protein n=1 Tax=Dendrobium thyrsiflorum TaxID=117978 RepID=A0ABD0V903_DENTH
MASTSSPRFFYPLAVPGKFLSGLPTSDQGASIRDSDIHLLVLIIHADDSHAATFSFPTLRKPHTSKNYFAGSNNKPVCKRFAAMPNDKRKSKSCIHFIAAYDRLVNSTSEQSFKLQAAKWVLKAIETINNKTEKLFKSSWIVFPKLKQSSAIYFAF